MKCKIPEISWHNRDPVLSVDIQPKTERLCPDNNAEVQRLASGGTDAHVLIWYMHFDTDTSNLELELAADLARHQRAVNVVKWSPNGQLLASGDDESVIFIWKLKSDSETLNILENTNDEDKEVWLTMKILRGHMEDVYDLCWSPDSLSLVSGSVDNTAMLWNVEKGKSTAILSDHKGFVQGVAWDPLNQYIATLSTDRYLRIFDIQTRKVLQRIHKCVLPVSAEHELFERQVRLYHDDTLQTFFRRMTFTPDGKLLITPAGLAEHEDMTQPLNTTYVYSRYSLKQPAIVLPSPDQYTVAVSCCPILFKLRAHSADNLPVVPLPYRMIFAVASRCSLYFYDTQQRPPFAVISNIHYTRLTDITWSNDGRIVVASSTDGFCSLITFDAGELGEEYEETAAMLLSREQATINNQTTKKSQKSQNNKSNNKAIPRSPKSEQANKQVEIVEKEKQKETPIEQDFERKSSAAKTIEEKENEELNFAMKKVKFAPVIEECVTPKKKPAMPIQIRRQPRNTTQILNEKTHKIMDNVEKTSGDINEKEKKEQEDEKVIEVRSETNRLEVQNEVEEVMEVDTEEKEAVQQNEAVEKHSEEKEATIEDEEIQETDEMSIKTNQEENEQLNNVEIEQTNITKEEAETERQQNVVEKSVEKEMMVIQLKEESTCEKEENRKVNKVGDEDIESEEKEQSEKCQEDNEKLAKEGDDENAETSTENQAKAEEIMVLDEEECEKEISLEENADVAIDCEILNSSSETDNNNLSLTSTETASQPKNQAKAEEKMVLDEEECEKEISFEENADVATDCEILNSSPETDNNNLSLTQQIAKQTFTPQQRFTPPSERTPRRVALRTISTPKSKKKIL